MNKQSKEMRERAVVIGKFSEGNSATGALLVDDGDFIAAAESLDGAAKLFEKEIRTRLLNRVHSPGTKFELSLVIIGEPIQEVLDFPS